MNSMIASRVMAKRKTVLIAVALVVSILLHETYANLDRLAVPFLLHPRETAPSCPQAFTDKPSAFSNKFLLFLEGYKGCLKLIYRFFCDTFSSFVFAYVRKDEPTKSPLRISPTFAILALDIKVSQCLTG